MTEPDDTLRRLGALEARISWLEARRITDKLWVIAIALVAAHMMLMAIQVDRIRALLDRL